MALRGSSLTKTMRLGALIGRELLARGGDEGALVALADHHRHDRFAEIVMRQRR